MTLTQIFKCLCVKYSNISNVRRLSHNPNVKILVPVNNRKLLKVSGKDAPNFLQGLITNDVRHFEDSGAKSIYAMFLNNKGRVLFDTLIYKWDDKESFLIECDNTLLSTLQKHLKLFKLKQAVNVEDVNKLLQLWALILPGNDIPPFKLDSNCAIRMFKDPRLIELGYRVIASTEIAPSDIVKSVSDKNVRVGDASIYKYLRYKLGVGEGAEELPPGSCFPLEVNCDYLHGVSFHKGCYIGQELTARVYHTGVVRKRLMPIKFDKVITQSIDKDTVIKSSKDPKSNLGKFKGCTQDCGLGLIRTKEALEAKDLVVGEHKIEVIKPSWWPIEAPKEKISTKLE